MPLGSRSHPAIPHQIWNAISADPYQTQFFAAQLLAIAFAGALLSRYTSTDRRVGALVSVIIAVAVASAIFGIVRQTNQHGDGVWLAAINPGTWLWAIHQSQPLCPADGNGVWINSRDNPRRQCEKRRAAHIWRITGAGLDGPGPDEFARWAADNDVSDCRRRFAVHRCRAGIKDVGCAVEDCGRPEIVTGKNSASSSFCLRA